MEETVDKVESNLGGVQHRQLKAVCLGCSRKSLSQLGPPSVGGRRGKLDGGAALTHERGQILAPDDRQ